MTKKKKYEEGTNLPKIKGIRNLCQDLSRFSSKISPRIDTNNSQPEHEGQFN